MRLADTVTVLDFGRRIAEGAPADVQNDPAVVRAYLGERPDAEETDR
ncbi:ABC transporter ATP-binding protein C-terminal domain-containing protein [Streptomyces sp. NPDC002692]